VIRSFTQLVSFCSAMGAQSLIKIPEDWAFQVAQRECQRGYMAGEDGVLIYKMEKKFIKAKTYIRAA